MDEAIGLESLSLVDLQLRAGILHKVINEAKENDDPRVANVQPQLDLIEAEIERRGNPQPQNIVIGLQPLRLHAKRG